MFKVRNKVTRTNVSLTLLSALPAPRCPVEFTCDSGAYSSGVGRNYRTGVKSLLHLFLWGELLGTARLLNRDEKMEGETLG